MTLRSEIYREIADLEERREIAEGQLEFINTTDHAENFVTTRFEIDIYPQNRTHFRHQSPVSTSKISNDLAKTPKYYTLALPQINIPMIIATLSHEIETLHRAIKSKNDEL